MTARNPDGCSLGVTDTKSAEQERIELNDRLLQAQEQERRRLSREIHDDFGQRLAVMTIKLQTLHATLTDRDTVLLVGEVMESFISLCEDIQAFSHQLHPSRVETLGLIPSIAALCADIAKHHHIQADFDHDDLSIPISAEARLSLYRIVQEALHNIVKHSGASLKPEFGSTGTRMRSP